MGRDRSLLDTDQINTVRQHEMREDETNVRVRLQNNVRNRFVELENLEPRDFSRLPETRKAIAILTSEKTTPEMRQDVRIISDPAALLIFKQRIQPLLIQGCATSNCHAAGSPNAGRFVLYNPADNEAATYTNFYYLTESWTEADSTRAESPFQQTRLKAIDRIQPRDSLILQYGLPRDIAEYDHPEVPNWNNVHRNTQDLRYQQVLSWIADVLLPVEPNYRKLFGHPLPWEDDEPQPQPNNPAPGGNPPR
jgi:hypothetical protein